MGNLPAGFSRLREGVFESNRLSTIQTTPQNVFNWDNEKPFNRRFVALTWYAPIFMSWPRERLEKEVRALMN